MPCCVNQKQVRASHRISSYSYSAKRYSYSMAVRTSAIRCNLRTGPKWITSRRGLLKLYPDLSPKSMEPRNTLNTRKQEITVGGFVSVCSVCSVVEKDRGSRLRLVDECDCYLWSFDFSMLFALDQRAPSDGTMGRYNNLSPSIADRFETENFPSRIRRKPCLILSGGA
jgi:hypothetical protein